MSGVVGVQPVGGNVEGRCVKLPLWVVNVVYSHVCLLKCQLFC
jgi:hypothetical protein